MPDTDIYAEDWKTWVGRENVTLRSRTALSPTYTDVTVSGTDGGAKKRALRRNEIIASNGVYTSDNLAWHLPTQNCGTAPRPGDIVLDGQNVSHTVLEVQINHWGWVYRCVTIALEIVNALSATGVLSRPAMTKDDASRRTFGAYTDITTGISCRVQPVDSATRDLLDRNTVPKQYSAWVAVALDVRANDRFTVAGVNYTIKGYKNPERLDQLLQLDLEMIP